MAYVDWINLIEHTLETAVLNVGKISVENEWNSTIECFSSKQSTGGWIHTSIHMMRVDFKRVISPG
jgi:hypothetical protein